MPPYENDPGTRVCPFCASRKLVMDKQEPVHNVGYDGVTLWVHCTSCGASGPRWSDTGLGLDETRVKAVKAWNGSIHPQGPEHRPETYGDERRDLMRLQDELEHVKCESHDKGIMLTESRQAVALLIDKLVDKL